MKTFADYFTIDAIINELCEHRIKNATKNHGRAFYDRISNDHQDARNVESDKQEDFKGLFPARRIWAKYRPPREQSKRLTASEITVKSLRVAVRKLMVTNPTLPWVDNLRERALAIRCRALESKEIVFSHQRIIGLRKKPRASEYRPITLYSTDDNIIQKLTARYLSKTLDFCFSESSHAYRCARREPEISINRESALRRINTFRENHQTVYVAEADLRGFMDCVDHALARQSLLNLITQAKTAKPTMEVDPRAIQLYDTFLSSYSFNRDVFGTALDMLRQKDPKGYFMWPTEELLKMHGGNDLDAIGIPQGGALSCFVVNVMLHETDQAMESIQIPRGHEILYLRFCDDMLILSSDLDICRRAMETYLKSIEIKKLPVHEPVDVHRSDDELDYTTVLDLKSKKPYLWARHEDGGIPWIQFLGYLIQFDGQFQIRPKSIAKQVQKITEEAKKLCGIINPGGKILNGIPVYARLKMRPHEILMRFYMKLVSISVGRRKYRRPLPACSDDIEPMCWANGYKFLWEVPYDPNQLRALDRHRERVTMQIYRRLEPFMHSKSDRAYADRVIQKIRKHGFRYSYYGQFAKNAEADQSRSLSNAPPRDEPKARFRHVVSSIFRWLCRW